MSGETPGPAPRQVLLARAVLVGVAVVHAIAIPVVLALQGTLTAVIRNAQPALSANEVHTLVGVELVRTISFHALLILVCSVYAAKIGSGSRRVLRIVVASQVLSVLFGLFTAVSGPDALRWLALLSVAAALVILGLLAGSPQSRSFFAHRPRRQ